MAVTRLMPLHVGKGKTISSALGCTVDYVENPDKTQGGELITAYQCSPCFAEQEFLFSKAQYTAATGRDQGDKDVIAYHLRQSFKPDEVTPERANQIGYQLAEKLTKGNHAFLVCTHTDKAHIHNHIIFNSTDLTCRKKFRNFWGSAMAIRKISDHLCVENGLSIVENPKDKSKDYGAWLDGKPKSQRGELRLTIDKVLCHQPKDWASFLGKMSQEGYEVKQGKYIAFRGKNQKQFIRLTSLEIGYSEEEIRETIKDPALKPLCNQDQCGSLVVDIQAKLQEGKGEAYENWAQLFNLKQAAKSVIFLQDNNLMNFAKLDAKTEELSATVEDLRAQIKAVEQRITDTKALHNHIIHYAKSKEVFQAYHKSGYSKKFFEEHRQPLLLRKAAKEYFDRMGLKKLPSTQSLRVEVEALEAEKNRLYGQYRQHKDQLKPLLIARKNVETLLDRKPTPPRKTRSSIWER